MKNGLSKCIHDRRKSLIQYGEGHNMGSRFRSVAVSAFLNGWYCKSDLALYQMGIDYDHLSSLVGKESKEMSS